jgi:hypothetical protein
MRRRALLFALLAGGLAAAGGVALGGGALAWHGAPRSPAAVSRAELADVPAPASTSRTRDDAGREHDTGHGVAAGVSLALALVLAGGWWLTRERAALVRDSARLAILRTRAPPRVPSTVHC